MSIIETNTAKASTPIKILTVIAVAASIIAILVSILPFFGAIAVPFGVVGFILSLITYMTRKSKSLKQTWSIIGLVLSVLGFTFGVINYQNHKNAVDITLGVPGAKSEGLLVPKDHPLREAVERGSGFTEEEINQRKQEVQREKEGNQSAEADRIAKNNAVKDPYASSRIIPPQPTVKEKTMHEKKTSGPINSYYYSIVDKLRMRSAPETSSEIVEHLNFGQQVRSLDEKTDQKESLTIAGIERNDYWYKVESVYSERKGWVYGGALVNATETKEAKSPDRLFRPSTFITQDSIFNLTGRRSYSKYYTYSGLMTYHAGETNTFNSNGKFYFRGYSQGDFPPIPGYGESEYLTGTMKSGSLDGEFKSMIGFFESYYDLTIQFKMRKCLSYTLIDNQEGEIYKSTGKKQADCSIETMAANLKHVN